MQKHLLKNIAFIYSVGLFWTPLVVGGIWTQISDIKSDPANNNDHHGPLLSKIKKTVTKCLGAWEARSSSWEDFLQDRYR